MEIFLAKILEVALDIAVIIYFGSKKERTRAALIRAKSYIRQCRIKNVVFV